MKDVQIRLPDRLIRLGDIQPGGTQQQRIFPDATSSLGTLDLYYTDETKNRVYLLSSTGGTYFGPGVGGQIVINLADKQIRSFDEKLGLWAF